MMRSSYERNAGRIWGSAEAQMDDQQRSRAAPEDDAKITLELLNAVEANSALTQRSVARELGIALGLANAYLKRCVHKGLIKVQQVPANRYAYYLTPRGFAEKSRLTTEYLSISFNFFRGARDQCSTVLADCARRSWKRVALAGVSDLAEIATLCAPDQGLSLVGIFDPNSPETRFAGLPVARRLEDLGLIDAVVITDLASPQAMFDGLIKAFPSHRVVAPDLLAISRQLPKLMD